MSGRGSKSGRPTRPTRRPRRQPPKPLGYHWDQVKPAVHPSGLPPCRWCKSPVRPPRRTFCDDDNCLIQWRMRTDPAYLRSIIFARDRGICRACGVDAKDYDLRRIDEQIRLHATLDIVHPSQRRLIVKRLETERSGPSADRSVVPLSSWLAMRATAVRWRKANKVYVNQPAWQDDHIIPVALGGDWFDLRNHQTLCCSCHHAKTKIDTRTIRERKADRPG